MNARIRLLLIEDNPADAELILNELRRNGFDPVAVRVDSQAGFVEQLGQHFDAILADYNLPQFDAGKALRIVQDRNVEIPFIIVSGSLGEEKAVAFMRHGAADYVLKDRLARLPQAVRQALERRRLRDSHRQAEDELRRSEERYRQLVENAHDVIYTHDLDGTFTSINRAGERLSGYSRDEILGSNIERYVPSEHLARTMEAVRRDPPEESPSSFEIELVTKDGQRVPLEVSTRLLYEGDAPVGVQGVARDISERRRAEEQIAFLVYHDKLTGLPGRAMFEELLRLAFARARETSSAAAVLSIDLDNFKLVNDSLGHAGGDELLRQFAHRLRAVARETDLVCRLGGDEFLLLLAGLEDEAAGEGPVGGSASLVAASVAARVEEALGEPFFVESAEVYVTASIGVAVQSQESGDAQTIIRNAHAAMFESKKAGPGGFVVFSRDSVQPFTELPFATRLRKAVERERWALHFQPILDLRTGELVAAEALVRWKGPKGKLIAPSSFIPLAEELGLIEAIGKWVLKEACRQQQAWLDEGLELDVTVNLSPRQFWKPDLASHILSSLDQCGMEPSRLIVEVTEATTAIDVDRTRRILWDLHRHGIRVAIDDFGTGSSSLSRLKDLPVDILKIDQSFVKDLPLQDSAATMVGAVIQLATSLGMTPLAEGIETPEQRRFLAVRGCVLGQGYLLSKPITARELAARFARRSRGEAAEGGVRRLSRVPTTR